MISVAICTWNRSELLHKTLQSLSKIEVFPNLEWELLVVDNNSTDDTASVIDSFKESLPLRNLVEKEQGLCQARNRAIRESRGDLLAYIDDDVLVQPDWLTEFSKAAERWPEAGYFAGKVCPWFESTPAEHVHQILNELGNGVFLGFDVGAEERRLRENENLRGANMMIRKSKAAGIWFDPAFGRNKDTVLFGDESDFCNRLREKGSYGVWVPSASLQHFVPRSRVETPYLKSFFHGLGLSMVRQGQVGFGEGEKRIPLWVRRASMGHCLGKYWKLIKGDRAGYFRDLTLQWRFRGVIDELSARKQA